MKFKKSVLFTFDYELFLGKKTGSIDECLLKPTDKLLKVLNRHRVKGIFFIDTIYLWRLKNEKAITIQSIRKYDKIISQLRYAVSSGHYIFPHLHPHWLDAVYLPASEEWDLSNTQYYKFSSLPESKQEMIFDISMNIIREIVSPVLPEYVIDAYRAGGWSIQPFSNFMPHFEKYNIQYDFSVIPGKKVISTAHSFDFSNAPQAGYYKFGKNIEEEDARGRFMEFSISSIYLSDFQRWLSFKLSGLKKRLGLNKSFGKGEVIIATVSEESENCLLNKHRYIASMEGINFILFLIYLKKIITVPYFQFISHPKLLTSVEIKWLNILLYFLKPFKTNSDYKKIK